MEFNKENFDAIIIGSGIGGLVTASQLAANWDAVTNPPIPEPIIIASKFFLLNFILRAWYNSF